MLRWQRRSYRQRTISWPAGVDFDPDVLHGDQLPASGTGPKVLREYHREPAR